LAEAETELGSGILMELSGGVLAAYELSKAIMLFGLPLFLTVLFWGKGIIGGILIYLLIVVLLILIKNTNPRVRIDHAMKYFWGWMSGAAIIAFLLAYFGV
jgi:NADH-quinone oxidoreductase subunit H